MSDFCQAFPIPLFPISSAFLGLLDNFLEICSLMLKVAPAERGYKLHPRAKLSRVIKTNAQPSVLRKIQRRNGVNCPLNLHTRHCCRRRMAERVEYDFAESFNPAKHRL